MINVHRIESALRVIYASSKLENERPLSCVLIGPSDAGKSQLILKARPQWVHVMNDFTFMTLIQRMWEVYDNGKGSKHATIVVPDFNAVIGHRPSVATLTSSVLLALLAEGLEDVPGMDGESKLKVEGLKGLGITASLITGVTPEMFASKRGKWRQTGLLRRILPINYSYRMTTVSLISSSISQGKDKVDYRPDFYKYPSRKVSIYIPESMADKINIIVERSMSNLSWKHTDRDGRTVVVKGQQLPFSLHKSFRVWAKASALLRGKTRVEMEDVKRLEDFACFVRYDRPEEI